MNDTRVLRPRIATTRTILVIAAILLIASIPTAEAAPQDDDRAEFLRLINLGKAYLENRNASEAIATLTEAVRLDGQSAVALRNLARAHLLSFQAEPAEKALDALRRVDAIEPDSAATAYLSGLALSRMARIPDAIPHFETAARLDPETAPVRYQLANALQADGRNDEAAAQLRETVRLDPLHASAHFRLSGLARAAGSTEEFNREMREFLRLRKLFGDETRKPLVLEQCVHTKPETAPDVPREPPAIEVVFRDVTDEAFAEPLDRFVTAAAVVDVDDAGRCRFFVAAREGRCALIRLSTLGRFDCTEVPLPEERAKGYGVCVVGNFHDVVPPGEKYDASVHAMNDVLLIGGGDDGTVCLLRRADDTTFEDVTLPSLLSTRGRRACWVDFDHDGDLDLVNGGIDRAEAWQNNGDATFTMVTAEVGLVDAVVDGVIDVAAADLDADVAVDVVAARSPAPTLVFENQRTGAFMQMPEPPGPWPSASRVLLDDLDNNGFPDAVLIADRSVTVLYSRTSRRERLVPPEMRITGGALVDFDNDGRLDLVAVGCDAADGVRGALRLWRGMGEGAWADVTEATGLAALSSAPVREVIAGDADGDGDSDLLLVTDAGGLRLLRNDGGDAGGQLKVRLITLKTNPSGFGTQVEIRAGAFRATRAVGALPIEIGLAGHTEIDSIQTIWTNGVVDNQVAVTAPKTLHTIKEKNVATGSCPFLYAWDGRTFRFVTDLLGNSPVGLQIKRGVPLPADPDEIVFVGAADRFPLRDGSYELKITDEFREIVYLDEAVLMAVDHAPLVTVHTTDKIMPPPFPRSDLVAMGDARRLLRATGSDGRDRTAALGATDGVYAAPGAPLPPPIRGMCRPLSIELEFDRLDPSRELVLALTGWLQYGDASTNIALSQNRSATIIPPTLEAETATGEWTQVDVIVGMPAGKTKTILCDLEGALPAGVRRLRLTTTFEIRWDEIALYERRPSRELRVHRLTPDSADLGWRGFSDIRSRGFGHPSTPDHDDVSSAPPWRTTPEGWCTRYGDVAELTTRRDDRLIIMNAGDALTLRFDAAALPPVPDGLVRSFFFYSVGWDKDEDHNVIEGETVLPLPVSAGEEWRLEWNTRFVPRERFRPVE